jgi:menaquinone reductase, molybdopterin-binding-like subunit
MDRRSFIKLTAISGTTAALASCGSPENTLIRFVPDEDIVPGQAVWKPSVCPSCASGCGLTVRVMDAEADVVRDGQAGIVQILAAKKLEGSPMYPVNRGALCARGQAAIQVTYHPDRITQPLKRDGEDRGSGRYVAISWDEAIKELISRLDALTTAGTQKALACVTTSRGHRAALLDMFLSRFGAPGAVNFELFGDDVLRRANALSFGRDQLPTYDLANARHVIAFGADFLGTWNSPVANAQGYGHMRQGRSGIRGSFVQVESRMSQTGANADEWVPARPGTEGVLALGLAHVIIAEKLRQATAGGRAGALISGWSAGLAEYSPEQVEKITGVAARRVERLAREFAERAPAVAIIGGAPLAHTNGLFSALAVNALNALVGSVGMPGGLAFTPQLNIPRPRAAGFRLAAAPSGADPSTGPTAGNGAYIGDAQLLLIDGANPIYNALPVWKLGETLARLPYIVSFGSFIDETSILSDLILPDHSFLETFAEAVPESGSTVAVLGVAPPVMKPLHNTRATPDVLLEVSRQLSTPLDLPWQTFEEMLTATVMKFPASSPDADAWTEAQEKGGWWGMPPVSVAAPQTPIAQSPSSLDWAEPQFDGDAQEYPMHLLPYVSSAFLDGSLAHLPWLQEMPDPMTSAMWGSWVEINPATAMTLGIGDGDIVDVVSTRGSVRLAAVITPGIAPDIVAIPAGQGHRSFTRFASGRGASPVDVISPIAVDRVGSVAWAATRVKVARVSGPDGRLVLFAGGSREHLEHGR